MLCDGRPDGLSAQLFRAVARRLREKKGVCVNDSWLDEEGGGGGGGDRGVEVDTKTKSTQPPSSISSSSSSSTPFPLSLALGHLINDPQGAHPPTHANVVFRTTQLSATHLPSPSLLSLVPTLTASGNNREERVVVCVVAAEAVEGGEEGRELLVEYGQDPRSVGYV